MTLIDLFSTLSALILPDNWTTANTFQIQILLALPLPIYGAAEHFKRRNEEQERHKQTKTKLRRVAHLHRGSPPDVVRAEVERARQAEEARVGLAPWALTRILSLAPVLALCLHEQGPRREEPPEEEKDGNAYNTTDHCNLNG